MLFDGVAIYVLTIYIRTFFSYCKYYWGGDGEREPLAPHSHTKSENRDSAVFHTWLQGQPGHQYQLAEGNKREQRKERRGRYYMSG